MTLNTHIISLFISLGIFSFSYAQSTDSTINLLDGKTVFAFSQLYNYSHPDQQILDLKPDMSIRSWNKWNTTGNSPMDFNFDIVKQYHNNGTIFIGGITSSVHFLEESADSTEYFDLITKNASNNLVIHSYLRTNSARANLANPAYRDYQVKMVKIQIDGGVDGMFFDEVISGFEGSSFNGNEGFDDYTIADFNEYLINKYPNYTKSDWIDKFGMTDTNFIDPLKSHNDLINNFNYREYLAVNDWTNNPLTSSNSLASEWGKLIPNRPDITTDNFLAVYTMKYWKDIVTRVRAYAKETYGKEFLITSNGIFPYVDFNSVGMYNWNKDDKGNEALYVPVKNGKLEGQISLQSVFKSLYTKSKLTSGDVPTLLFIDWPTQMMDDYNKLSVEEHKNYWKIYAAEAYANGLFMTFHLMTSISTDTTAKEKGILDFFKTYSAFYRDNKFLFQNNILLDQSLQLSHNNINNSLMKYNNSDLLSIHLVNHNYTAGTGINLQSNLEIKLSIDSIPNNIYSLSPDQTEIKSIDFKHSNDQLTISLDVLNYYKVLVLDYGNSSLSIESKQIASLSPKIFPNPSNGLINIQFDQIIWSKIQGKEAIISDINGKTIKHFEIENKTTQIHLSSGTYFFKLVDTNSRESIKFTVY